MLFSKRSQVRVSYPYDAYITVYRVEVAEEKALLALLWVSVCWLNSAFPARRG